MNKPRILITNSNINSSALADLTGDTEIIYSDKASAEAVIQAGGLPFYMPALSTISEADIVAYLTLADGVLLTGADTNTNPLHYNEPPTHLKGRIDDERDRVEISLVKLAHDKKLPLFGICKGMQVMNVALGGTLYQDISAQHSAAINHDIKKTNRANLTHANQVAKESLLGQIFGKTTINTNAGHQQAVKQLAPGLVATATSEDDIIEAYEDPAYPFLIGVQFHPELRTFDPHFFALFEQFINAASKNQPSIS